jgi:hypothetical protein
MVVKQANDLLAKGDKTGAAKIAEDNPDAGLYLKGKEYKSKTTEQMNVNNAKITKLKDQIKKIANNKSLSNSEKRDQTTVLEKQVAELQKGALRKINALSE